MTDVYYIAAAGSGKTTHLVKKALKLHDKVLITTFTEENKAEILNKFLELNEGILPSNVTIQTWFSFLIEHGAKPYQGTLTNKHINGLLLVNKKSGLKGWNGRYPVYYSENEIDQHYFTKDYAIYSDKLSKFVVKCNDNTKGAVISRIANIFPYIFIDEVQDMAGYDLEIIKLLFMSRASVNIAGDPRQVTYHTHFADKYKKYSNGKLHEFIKSECKSLNIDIDYVTLKDSWRNNKIICDFANTLFPELPPCNSHNSLITGHDGIFFVREKDIPKYLQKFNPTQLRYSKSKKVEHNYEVKNYGGSKGIGRDRIIIYPTEPINDWINKKKPLTFKAKCQLYVAITRARYSVAIVCDNNYKPSKFSIFNCD